MTRKYLTPRRKRDLLWIQGGRCAECRTIINMPKGEKIEADHLLALGIGGGNGFENFQILCPPCHAEKTKTDVRNIAKAKRVAAKFEGSYRPARRKIMGSRGTKFKRKVDGTTVRRETGETI